MVKIQLFSNLAVTKSKGNLKQVINIISGQPINYSDKVALPKKNIETHSSKKPFCDKTSKVKYLIMNVKTFRPLSALMHSILS